jgi:hypothetical protein
MVLSFPPRPSRRTGGAAALLRTLLASTALAAPLSAQAEDAIWRGGVDANWNQAFPFSGKFNWGSVASGGTAPTTVPTNTAFFPDNPNNRYAIFFGQPSTSIQNIQFTSAEAYSFFLVNQTLNITGTGIINNSPVKPSFSVNQSAAQLNFLNDATASNANIATFLGGTTTFADDSNADSATITNNSNGATVFTDTADARVATIITRTG